MVIWLPSFFLADFSMLDAADTARLITPPGTAPFSSMLPGLPPQPTKVPRRKLGKNFAVLLLRSGYDVADELDFIAMNEFQREFWLRRSAEWQPYLLQHKPLQVTQVYISAHQKCDILHSAN